MVFVVWNGGKKWSGFLVWIVNCGLFKTQNKKMNYERQSYRFFNFKNGLFFGVNNLRTIIQQEKQHAKQVKIWIFPLKCQIILI